MDRRPLLSIEKGTIVSASDCTIETHLTDPGDREVPQVGMAGGNQGTTDTVYKEFF